MPLVARKMAEGGQYDAVVCLGAVIREYAHFDYVGSRRGSRVFWRQASLSLRIVTTETLERRSAGWDAHGQQGAEAMTAIEMVRLLRAWCSSTVRRPTVAGDGAG